jgi:transcriptional regulator with XRE-family HTH domain
MDVVYVRPADYAEMILTPGQYLEVELERLGLDKAKLARKMGIRQATVSDWCSGKGAFNGKTAVAARNRREVERVLGLPKGHLDKQSEMTIHRDRCAEALEEFLNSPIAPKDITELEMTNLRDTLPPINLEPDANFYETYLFLLRNKLKPSRYAEELAENRELAKRVEKQLEKAYEPVEAKSEDFKKKRAKPPHKSTPQRQPRYR